MSNTPIEQALAQILADVEPLAEQQRLPLDAALGAVLAEPVLASIDVPPHANSAMDGYAMRAADVAEGPFTVSQRIPAGAAPQPLQAGTVARIFTGAVIPAGADTVVIQEDVTVDASGAVLLNEPHLVVAGDNVRYPGEDIQSGQAIFPAGQRLSAQDLGVIASVGVASLQVFRRPRVAILSTGDELVEPGTALKTGQIYNSNRYSLQALIESLGFDCVDVGIVPDDPGETEHRFRQAAAAADCIISTGGVSVGEEDHVKAVVERLGELRLWKLAIKPGKPLSYGRVLGVPFIGLPGNPAAVFVTFCLVARPYLLALAGAGHQALLEIPVRADFARSKPGIRQEYLRVKLENRHGELWALPYRTQSSGVLSALSWSNALAVVPIGKTVEPGDWLGALLLSELIA